MRTLALNGATTIPGVLIEFVICPLAVAMILAGMIALWRFSVAMTFIQAWVKRADHILFPTDGPGLPETVRGILSEIRTLSDLAAKSSRREDQRDHPT